MGGSQSQQFFEICAAGDVPALVACLKKSPGLARAKNTQGLYGLCIAINHNRYGAVKALLMEDPTLVNLQLDIPNGMQHSQPIHHTCVSHEKLDILKLLIEYKADVNSCCYHQRDTSVLYLALNAGFAESAKYLIDHGANVNEHRENVIPPIHACSDLNTFKLLVENKADINCIHPHTQGTILHSFIHKSSFPGFWVTFQEILSHCSFSLDHQDKNNETVLSIAVHYGKLEEVKLLVEAKASVVLGGSILDKALSYSNYGIVSYLLEQPDLPFPPIDVNNMSKLIHNMLLNKQMTKKAIFNILQRGLCNLDILDPKFQHPLIFSIFNPIWDEDIDWFQSILGLGVNINSQDMYGLSLLHKAVLKSIDLVNLLLKNGAEPNIKDNTGATPLSLAAQAQKLDVVRVLYQHGCDIFHKDNSGKRPIDWILPVPLFEEFISELKTAHGEEFIHKLK